MKKHQIILLLLLACTSQLFAQAPQGFNYQAMARDSDGEAMANESIFLSISILKDGVSGSPIFTETFTTVTNENGVFSLQIGTGNTTLGDFSAIDWSSGKYFIGTSISTDGGNEFKLLGTQQLMSVPFALYANSSGTDTDDECAEGFIQVNENYCIEVDDHEPVTWFEAVRICGEMNAQLCSWSQWYYAAQKNSLSLENTTDNWEWINDGGDDKSNNAKAVGLGETTADDSFDVMEVVNSFRCCCNK